MSDGLRIRDLSVSYRDVPALRGVDIDVDPGGFVAVLGANGAGKTTLIRSVTGLLYLHRGRVTRGTAELDGRSLIGTKSRVIVQGGVAQVPEGRKLFARLNVEENLLCGAASRKDVDGIQSSLDDVWELFPQLERLRSQTAGLLSGGEQQMVAVGRALMSKPKLLICDELSLGLAPQIVHQLFELLDRLNREDDVAVLVIEQNARLALQYARSAYVLELGQVYLEGPSEELRDNQHVQDLYLGGAGEAIDGYAAIREEYRGG